MGRKLRLLLVWILVVSISFVMNFAAYAENDGSGSNNGNTSVHVVLSPLVDVSDVHVIVTTAQGTKNEIALSKSNGNNVGNEYKADFDRALGIISEIHVKRTDGTEQIFNPADYLRNGGNVPGSVTYDIDYAAMNRPPVAQNDSAAVNDGTTPVTINVLVNDTDADNNRLTVYVNEGSSYEGFDNNTGTLVLSEDCSSFTYTPAIGFVGTTTFIYRAYDGYVCSSNTATVTIKVNGAPVANNDSYLTKINTSINISSSDILKNDIDPNSDTLSMNSITAPQHGTLTANNDGSFTYAPAAGFTGTDSFTYKAFDGYLSSEQAAVNITVADDTPANNPPVANNDSYVVIFGNELDVAASNGLLVNDSEKDPVALTVQTQPAYGNVQSNKDGSFTYTPDLESKFTGDDTFIYSMNDGKAESNTATVTITITYASVKPILEYVQANKDHTYTAHWGYLNENGAEVDAQVSKLTGNVISGSENLPATGFKAGRQRDVFTTVFDGSNLVWTLKGPDGKQRTATASANAARPVINTQPAAYADAYSVTQGTSLVISNAPNGVLANDSDADKDSLTAVDASAPSHGTVEMHADGTFTYIPNADFYGTDSFTYKAYDGWAKSEYATVTITVTQKPSDGGNPQYVNHAPTAADHSYTVQQDTTLSVETASGLLKGAYDQDNNSMTAVNPSAPSHGRVEVNSDGSFKYYPAAGFTGTDSFTYKVSDGSLTSTNATVTITVSAKPSDDKEEPGEDPTDDNGQKDDGQPADGNDQKDDGQTPETPDNTGDNGTVVDLPDENVPEAPVDIDKGSNISANTEKESGEKGTLPKTGGIPSEAFYGLGSLLAALGVFLRKKR